MGFDWPPRGKRFKRPSKFGAVRCSGFASKLEAAVHQVLILKANAGRISEIRLQDSVDLTCGINWKVDFSYMDHASGLRIWVEAKGVESERFRICLKLWRIHGPGPLELWKGRWEDPRLARIIRPSIQVR
jgi:hypothetical protein